MQHVAMIPGNRNTLSVCSAPAVINGHSTINRELHLHGYSTDDDINSDTNSRMTSHPWKSKLNHQLGPDYSRLISELIECEKSVNIVNYKFPLNRINDQGNHNNTSKVLCELGDNIVCQLVQWMRHLPFYGDIPLPLHTKLLTKRWHEILLLTMAVHQPSSYDSAGSKTQPSYDCAWSKTQMPYRRKPVIGSCRDLNSAGESMNSDSGGATSSAPDDLTSSGECSNENSNSADSMESHEVRGECDSPKCNQTARKNKFLDFSSHLNRNMDILHKYMTENLMRDITMTQMIKEVGVMMEKVTYLIRRFQQLKLSKDEYVCLKVILLLNHGKYLQSVLLF